MCKSREIIVTIHEDMPDVPLYKGEEIVRCKDCKREKDTEGMFTICSLTELIVDDDCYCWWGERREP